MALALGLWICPPQFLAAQVDGLHFEAIVLTNLSPTIKLELAWRDPTLSPRPVILTLGALHQELPFWSTNLINAGFAIGAFTADYPPEPDPARRPIWLKFDERFAHSYAQGGARTPTDASRVIDYLCTRSNLQPRGIGWLGSSTTGIFGLAAATREPRIRALVAFVATGAYARWFDTWKPNHLWSGGDSGLWPETRSLLAMTDPILRATNLFPCATLLINGSADKVVDVSSARAFFEAARPAYTNENDRLRLVVYDGEGHNLPRDIVPLYAEHWFKRYLTGLNDGRDLPTSPASVAESVRQSALTSTPHDQLIIRTNNP